MIEWLHAQGWHYRLRLKGNLNVDLGFSQITTTGELAAGYPDLYLTDLRWFNHGVQTNLRIRNEPGHPEPWIIAMTVPLTGPRCAIMAVIEASIRCYRTSKVAVLTWKPPACAPRIAWIACC